MYTYLLTYLPTYLPTCLPAYLLPAYLLPTYLLKAKLSLCHQSKGKEEDIFHRSYLESSSIGQPIPYKVRFLIR